MTDALFIIALTFFAGLCMPLGGLLAAIEHIHPKWLQQEFRHFAIALGGGLLLGAIYSILLPEGLAGFGETPFAVFIFLAGGFSFFLVERSLGLRRHDAPQLMGMLLDYIPESIALGGLAVINPSLAITLAIIIGLQNIPEGFNAYRELVQSGKKSKRVLSLMLSLTPLGSIAGLGAHYGLHNQPQILGGIMLFAAGGILYLVFQDIAPQSRLNRHWAPPLGAVLGFSISLLTDMMVPQ